MKYKRDCYALGITFYKIASFDTNSITDDQNNKNK